MSKCIVMTSILDDVFDVYGTLGGATTVHYKIERFDLLHIHFLLL